MAITNRGYGEPVFIPDENAWLEYAKSVGDGYPTYPDEYPCYVYSILEYTGGDHELYNYFFYPEHAEKLLDAATTPKEKTNLTKFIEKYGIDATVIPSTSLQIPDSFPVGSHAWMIHLTGKEGILSVPFFTVPGVIDEPTIETVLAYLGRSSAHVESADYDFESWAKVLGNNTDSRRAEQTFLVFAEQAKRLRRWLGDSAYAELLWEVEK